MSLRALKAKQRLLQKHHGQTEVDDDGVEGNDDLVSSEDEEETTTTKTGLSLFLLEDENAIDAEEEDVVTKEDVLSPSPTSELNPEYEDDLEHLPKSSSSLTATAAAQSKKKKKKGRKTKSKASTSFLGHSSMKEQDEDLDQLIQDFREKALAAEAEGDDGMISVKNANSSSCLKVESRYFDADAELQLKFGRIAIQSDIEAKRYIKQGSKKHVFATPRQTWPKMGKIGLSMVSLPIHEDQTSPAFTFTHSKEYQFIQHQFWEAQRSHDPQNIMHLMRLYPYHIDSLLTMSAICKSNGEYDLMTEFVDRALYTFERSFHPLFKLNGGVRLPYAYFENRSFYLALNRHLWICASRGCWRVALEVAKFVYSLDESDPLGMLLVMDYFALRSEQYDWILTFYEAFQLTHNLFALGCWAFSRALAEFLKNVESGAAVKFFESNASMHTSSRRLRKAFLAFPHVLDALQISVDLTMSPDLPPSLPVSFDQVARSSNPVAGPPLGYKLLCNLFTTRHLSLYKAPEVVEWFKWTLLRPAFKDEPKAAPSGRFSPYRGKVPRNILRHCVACDVTVPSILLEGEPSLNQADPLPPSPSHDGYGMGRIGGAGPAPEGELNPLAVLQGFFGALLPWDRAGA